MESEPSGDRKKVNLAGVAVVVAGAGVGAAVVGAAVVGAAVVGGVVPASVFVLPGRQERVIMRVKWIFLNVKDRTRRNIRMKEESCKKESSDSCDG